MPTVGWILEGAIEKFWEVRDRIATHIPPPVFVCNRCGRTVSTPEELRRHVSLEHPLELPVLYVHGEPLLREYTLRSVTRICDVELVQCTRCEVQVDGGSWLGYAIPEFRREFARPANATWNIRLIHERAEDSSRTESDYHVRFRIPDVPSLNAVDEHFIRILVLEELSHDDLQSFEAGFPQNAPAREYAGALGDYALGIILKERRNPPHAPVGFEEFVAKMRSALEILRPFNRPVALAVCSSIRFNLNDFHDYGVVTETELEAGLHFFRGITGETADGAPHNRPTYSQEILSRNAICPVDQVSYRLLSACACLSEGTEIPLAELESLQQLPRGTVPVSDQDLAKIHVICAEAYLRLGRTAEAIPHLQAIQFDPVLRNWTQHKLDSF